MKFIALMPLWAFSGMTFQKSTLYGLTNSNVLVSKTLRNAGLDNLLGMFWHFENVKNWYYVNISTNYGPTGKFIMDITDS